jgi:hypothetical protein
MKSSMMVLGEMDDMNPDDEYLLSETQQLINTVISLLFISLMCVIILNLFIGIAVGEIKTVLYEADIQQISMRIIFVLKVQKAFSRIQKVISCLFLTYFIF